MHLKATIQNIQTVYGKIRFDFTKLVSAHLDKFIDFHIKTA